MEKKISKDYNKAIDYCEKGELAKALEVCEASLAKDLGNSEILNLKGLLLYQKGELKDAVTVWKINCDLNNNEIAENYVKDAKSDEERLKLYKEAEQELKKSNADRALSLFMQCTKSDFNTIKVNTGIALCYQKKGDYFRSREYVDKALSIDKNAITATKIKKELDEMDNYYGVGQKPNNKLMIVTVFVIIAAICAGGYSIIRKINNSNSEPNEVTSVKESGNEDSQKIDESNKEESSNENKEIEAANETSDEDNSDVSNTEVKEFNKDKVSELMTNKDFDGLYAELNNVKQEDVKSDDKGIYNQAIDLMKTEGVAKFYDYGLWNFNQKNYENAKKELDKAYTYCEGNNLKQHILFYRGSTASAQSDNDLAVKEYEEYYNLYPDGSYVEGVLYELALLNTDKEKSKKYANDLINRYPKSIYINDKISDIINN